MKLSKQVCSLEPAEKLKELKVNQGSLWYWVKYFDGETSKMMCSLFQKNEDDKVNEHISAFTVAELGEMLPNDFMSYKKDDDMWLCCKHHPEIGKDNEMIMEFAEIEADARAKMLIYLIESKLIKVEDL
ncbi:hypothetical protein KAU34_10635 [candidate division WOR-3 bacterium]|nr:hypothetical protein [candidate division WOR-3 bacterium]